MANETAPAKPAAKPSPRPGPAAYDLVASKAHLRKDKLVEAGTKAGEITVAAGVSLHQVTDGLRRGTLTPVRRMA